MKLIIQIPCLNEEETLAETLKSLPREIEGIDYIETLIIDDGSSDKTVSVARENGANHIVQLAKHQGLAKAFIRGINTSLKLGADIIVNTDADNQYDAQDIEKLIEPILRGEVDMTIGDRQTDTIPHFSPVKKKLQKMGSWVIRHISKTEAPDATSGFRAYNKKAALRLNVVSDFTYTLETIIQIGQTDISMGYVPVRTNAVKRPSRLFSSIFQYIMSSVFTILRIYTMYAPLKFFSILGGVLFFLGSLLFLRFLYYYIALSGNTGHTQSLILGAVLIMLGFQNFMIGLVGDIISANRKLLEDALLRIKLMELDAHNNQKQP
ncbi:glycosyltransferase family 2 protein [candidate division CSSED10-310 bacterium]|uniref:Glycosyltransferase family 2 protein n=1 Tax=candidate division CSSED10-310 bacterium TaxID=2855610 RepID=A0ABV6YWR4_UNCC1